MQKFAVKVLKTRLDKFLAEQATGKSRSQIQKDIEAERVLVNGKVITESKFVVRKGDEINFNDNHNNNKTIKPTNIPLKVLYDNHGLLIIDKPAGMVVHPGAGFKGETLASALLYQFKNIHLVGEEHRPGIVHRLDKDTSGVMLVAATQEMYEYLKDAFAERKIKKEYIALVYGKVEKPHGFIETPIGKSKKDFRKQTVENPVEAKEALTEYKVLEYLEGGHTTPSRLIGEPPLPPRRRNGPNSPPKVGGVSASGGGGGIDEYTLLLVKLHTGRTHQIRVHFLSLGHPLMGDELYSPRLRSDSKSGKKSQLDGLQRQFLHAKKIEVQLPDGTWIEAESELADDLKEVLVSLKSKMINSL